MKEMPEYARDPVYMELERLCIGAGYHIVYLAQLPESDDLACTDGLHQIGMPMENIYASPEQAGVALAHELAHYLIGDFYCSSEQHNSDNDYLLSLALESDCNRVGVAVYRLAERIAMQKAEQHAPGAS